MANVMAVRSERRSVLQIGLLSNKALLGTVSLSVLLQLALVYLPFLQAVFGTTALSLRDLVLVFAIGSLIFIAVEFEKRIVGPLATDASGGPSGRRSSFRTIQMRPASFTRSCKHEFSEDLCPATQLANRSSSTAHLGFFKRVIALYAATHTTGPDLRRWCRKGPAHQFSD
jgi:hypothetical protein